mmetsp:Transcript_26961/g.83902  ORF Transcript_26961/g.83902 Transcript_26961/m.83902 type:complete len:187 (-) Transcript_26961:84-644(-)
MPASWLALRLWRRFPGAKVILTTRSSPRDWFASLQQNQRISAQLRFPPYRLSRQCRLQTEINLLTWGERDCIDASTGHVTDGHLESCIASHERHSAAVRAGIPNGQLLEYRVSQGWKPLCDFLGASPPSRGFPREWTRGGVTLALYSMYLSTAAACLFLAALPLCSVWCCLRCMGCWPRRAPEKEL